MRYDINSNKVFSSPTAAGKNTKLAATKRNQRTPVIVWNKIFINQIYRKINAYPFITHYKNINTIYAAHLPSGIVKQAQTRSRMNSVQEAMKALNDELDRLSQTQCGNASNTLRMAQIGTGERSDKIRTYRFQDGMVHDHKTGNSAPISKIMRGEFHLLW